MSSTDRIWWRHVSDMLSAASRGDESPDAALRLLQDGLHVDAAMLSVADAPQAIRHHTIASIGYPAEVVEFMNTAYVRRCPGFGFAKRVRFASRICDTPFDFRATRTYREALEPAGFHEGVTVPFSSPWNGHPGFLALSSTSAQPIADEDCLALTLLATSLALLAVPSMMQVENPNPEEGVLDVDVQGRLHWLRQASAEPAPVAEEHLREFARHMRVSRRTRAGFFTRACGEWWHVQGRSSSGIGTSPVVRITLSPETPRGSLTQREIEILALMCHGLTNRQIAHELFVTLATVKTHVETLLRKLGQPNRAGLVAVATAEDLVSFPPVRPCD